MKTKSARTFDATLGCATRRGALAVLAVVSLAACAPDPAPPAAPTPAPAASADERSGAPTAAELEAIYRARTDSARTRYTEADVAFMVGMIHHHAQAIEMGRLAPERASHGSIRTLAARIINAQEDEIATMQRWLRDRGQPVPELHVMGDRVMVHGAAGHDDHDPDALMPGMLTRDQLRQLRQATGPAFDRLFLEYMIEHHRGAVAMVHTLFATDGAGQDEDVFRFASDVQVDQATEVARMERMLAELFADDAP